jgi:hypothetical protein
MIVVEEIEWEEWGGSEVVEGWMVRRMVRRMVRKGNGYREDREEVVRGIGKVG